MGFIDFLLQLFGLKQPMTRRQKPNEERTPPPAPRQPKPQTAPPPVAEAMPGLQPTSSLPEVSAPLPDPPKVEPEKPEYEPLSEHFTLTEMIASETAARCRIDNMPPPNIVENMRVAAAGMERVRDLLGGAPIHITSCYRCPPLNKKVGSTDGSAHVKGYAVDFVAPSFGSPYDIARKLSADKEFMNGVDQLIHEFGAWVHVSFEPRRRHQAFTLHYLPGDKSTHTTNGIIPLTRAGCPAKLIA